MLSTLNLVSGIFQFIKQLIKFFCAAFLKNPINRVFDIITEGFLLRIGRSLNTLTWLLLFYYR